MVTEVETKSIRDDGRRFPYYVIFILILTLPLLIMLAHKINLWRGFLWENEPFHSTIETIGALIAIAMA